MQAGHGRRVRTFYEIGGLLSQFRFVAFDNDVQSANCALLERVYYHERDGIFEEPIKPSFGAVRKIFRNFTREFSKYVTHSHPVALSEYYKVYIGRRRALYERACEKVSMRGYRAKDAILSTFIKYEKLPEIVGKRLVPRLVQPRKPEYNVCVGRYIRHLEHTIFALVGRVYNSDVPVIMKGYNAFSRAHHMRRSWDRIASPCAIGLDATRFDQHVNPSLLRWEHERYLSFYSGGDRRELAKILKAQVRNKGYIRCADGTISYSVYGGRCSGDMNTALGNCLIMCATVYSYMQFLGIGHCDYALINDGDDCVLIVHSDDAPRVIEGIPNFFNQVGLLMKVEKPVFVFEDISFCQTHPVWDGREWRLVRSYPESISKDATVLRDVTHPRVFPRYLRALGDCGIALTAGIPIFQEFYECMRRSASGTPLVDPMLETGMARLAYGLSPRYEAVSDDARVSFWKAFGVLPEVQIEFEAYYKQLTLSNMEVTLLPPTRMVAPFAHS
jgi:hypothetical protein